MSTVTKLLAMQDANGFRSAAASAAKPDGAAAKPGRTAITPVERFTAGTLSRLVRKGDEDHHDPLTAVSRGNELGPGTAVGFAAALVGEKPSACEWHKHDDAMAAEPSHVAMIQKGADLTAALELVPSLEASLLRTAKARLLRSFGAGLLGAPAATLQTQRRLVSIADKCSLLSARPSQVRRSAEIRRRAADRCCLQQIAGCCRSLPIAADRCRSLLITAGRCWWWLIAADRC